MSDSFKFTIPTAFDPPPTKTAIQAKERAERKAKREADRKERADLSKVQPNLSGTVAIDSPTKRAYSSKDALYESRGPRTKEAYVGKRYGRLIGQVAVGRNVHGDLIIRCACDCGQNADILLSRLRKLQVISCGGCNQGGVPFAKPRIDKALLQSAVDVIKPGLIGLTASRSEGCEISKGSPDSSHSSSSPRSKSKSKLFEPESRSFEQIAMDQKVAQAFDPHRKLSEDELDYDSWLADLKNPNK